MSPYRSPAPDALGADSAEVTAFALAHRRVRARALGVAAMLAGLLSGALVLYGWWLYFGHHCGCMCMW